ncbi:unnamed protein product [Schistosoma turkestanicum]|nr:unnamed protein product [Schistosoma turkestanicum]
MGNSCDKGNLDKHEQGEEGSQISLSSDCEIKSNNDLDKENSQSVWFRAQKHIVGQVLQNEQSIKSTFGESAYELLKALYALMKLHMNSETNVEQVYSHLIKTIGKIVLISQQQNLTDKDYKNIYEIIEKSRKIVLTVIGFAQTDYTYNYNFLKEQLDNCKDLVYQAVSPYLSQKSIERINFVFHALSSNEFLDSVYDQTVGETKKVCLRNLVDCLTSFMKRDK